MTSPIGGNLLRWGLLVGAASAAVALLPAVAGAQSAAPGVYPGPARIIVRPPVFHRGEGGALLAEPNVSLSGAPGKAGGLFPPGAVAIDGMATIPPVPPAPGADGPGPPDAPPSDPLFERIAEGVAPPEVVFGDGEYYEEEPPPECDYCDPLHQLFAFKLFKTRADEGIGHERVMLAPMELDISQPLNNFRARYETYQDMVTPDRAEYFWARPGVGPPLPERRVDYQDLRFLLEVGGGRFSMLTEIPIRSIDPVVNDNTTGLGDINFGPKTVLVNGRRWQLSTIFRTFLRTSSTKRGLGPGHVALEPGLLLRYEWTKQTYLHAELKYRFAAGGNKDFTGQVMRYGLGVSTIAYETDTFAMLPTLEFVGWMVMDGEKSLPSGSIVGVDGENFGAVYPGLRFVLGPAGDLGLFELGVQPGFGFGDNGFFETHFKVDLRFSY